LEDFTIVHQPRIKKPLVMKKLDPKKIFLHCFWN